MPYIYNSSALLSASVSDNLQPITAPPVNRHLYPWGIDFLGGSGGGYLNRHIPLNCMIFVPVKVASTITVDRIGMYIVDPNSCTDTWYYRFGLYTNNSTDNYPNTLIADLGQVSFQPGVDSPGVFQIAINQTLNANTTYWIAIGITASGGTDMSLGRTPLTYQIQGDFALFRKRGLSAINSASAGIGWAHSIGSFSGTLPASVSYASNSASTGFCIRTPLRRSS
jgi:hypothetical protein